MDLEYLDQNMSVQLTLKSTQRRDGDYGYVAVVGLDLLPLLLCLLLSVVPFCQCF